MMIPAADPRAQYLSHKDEIDCAVARVLDSGRYILGEETKKFELEFSSFLRRDFAIGVGSGTEALHIALTSCGIGDGDEVITVSHTAVATVAAIELCGARPVLIDVDRETLTMNPKGLSAAITRRTRAVIPVHLYGQPADMSAILEIAGRSNIRVIEDCAQSLGARYRGLPAGSIGEIGCFSFYPTKNLGAIGDGGMIVTNNPDIAERARLIREYGWAERNKSSIPGMNSRLDEIQAAILRVKLKYLDRANALRIHLASLYNKGLQGTSVLPPRSRPRSDHVYHLYVIRSKKRDTLRTFLMRKKIHTMIHYPFPVHQQPAYTKRVRCAGDMAETDQAARDVLSLPMYPELAEADVERVIEAVRTFDREGT